MSQLIDNVVGGILDSRKKSLAGYSYKLQENGGYGLDAHVGSLGEVNESEMSVVFPFAEGRTRDGGGDLLDIGGIDVSRHVRNPLVMVDHGKTVPFPVGLAENPETREYTIKLDPVGQVATCKAFFYRGGQDYDHSVFCEQLFDLVRQKFIRSGSIGYQIKYAEPIPPDYRTGTPQGLHLKSVLLLEASIVVMPMNAMTVMKSMPDAREILCKGSVCGKPLSPYLVKSLAPYAEAKAVVVGGYGGKAEENKKPSLQDVARMTPEQRLTHAASRNESAERPPATDPDPYEGTRRGLDYWNDPPNPPAGQDLSDWKRDEDATKNDFHRWRSAPETIHDTGEPGDDDEKALLSRKRRAAEILDDEQALEQFERWYADNAKEGDKVTEAASRGGVPASVRKLTAEGPDVRGKAVGHDSNRQETDDISNLYFREGEPLSIPAMPGYATPNINPRRTTTNSIPRPTAPTESKVPQLTPTERARVDAGEAERRAAERETAQRYEDASRKKSVQVPRVTNTRIPPSEWRPGVGAVKRIDNDLVKSIRRRVKANPPSDAEVNRERDSAENLRAANIPAMSPRQLEKLTSEMEDRQHKPHLRRQAERNTGQKGGPVGPGSRVQISTFGDPTNATVDSAPANSRGRRHVVVRTDAEPNVTLGIHPGEVIGSAPRQRVPKGVNQKPPAEGDSPPATDTPPVSTSGGDAAVASGLMKDPNTTRRKGFKSIKDKYRGAKSQPGHSGEGSRVSTVDPYGNAPGQPHRAEVVGDYPEGDTAVRAPGRRSPPHLMHDSEMSEVAPPPRRGTGAGVTGDQPRPPKVKSTHAGRGVKSMRKSHTEDENEDLRRDDAGRVGKDRSWSRSESHENFSRHLAMQGQDMDPNGGPPNDPDYDWTKSMPNEHAPDFDRDGSGAIDTPQEHAAVEKYSLTCLKQMHEDARILLQEYYEMSQPLDHEGVGRVMQRKLEDLVSDLEMLEAMAEKYHPGSMLEGGEDVPPEEAPVDVPPEGDVSQDPVAEDVPQDAPPPDPNAAVDEFDYAEDLDDAERAVEEDTDVVAQGNTDAVQADSSTEPPPTEDEVVEGMRKAGPVRAGVKDLRKQFTKGCKACGFRACKCVKSKRMKPKGKAVVGKKGAKAYGDPMNTDPLAPPAPRAAATPSAPVMRGDMVQVKGMGDEGSLLDHELHHVREAHGFLGEIQQEGVDWGDEHRKKSYHFSKMLDCIGNIGTKGDDKTAPGAPGTRKKRRGGSTTGVPGGTADAPHLPPGVNPEPDDPDGYWARAERHEQYANPAFDAGAALETDEPIDEFMNTQIAERNESQGYDDPVHGTRNKLRLRRRRGADYGAGVTIGDKDLDDKFHKASDDERRIEDNKKRDRDNDDVEIDLAEDPGAYGEGSLHPHREACLNAGMFFKALSDEKAYGDPHREAAAYHHSILGEIVTPVDEQEELEDEMPDQEPIQEDIEENEVVENVEGPGWEPGEMDEKMHEEVIDWGSGDVDREATRRHDAVRSGHAPTREMIAKETAEQNRQAQPLDQRQGQKSLPDPDQLLKESIANYKILEDLNRRLASLTA